jgi:hypothetical protein
MEVVVWNPSTRFFTNANPFLQTNADPDCFSNDFDYTHLVFRCQCVFYCQLKCFRTF